MFLILCELALYFCVVMASQKSDNTIVTRQPLGLQMCVKLCSTYGRFGSHTFDPVQLRCTLKIMTVKPRSCHGVNVTTKVCATRTRYSRTIHTRKMGFRNVTLKVSRYKNADKKDVTRNKKAKKKGVTRNKKADKTSVTRNKKADKEDKDVTQKSRRKNKLVFFHARKTWYGARDHCKRKGWTLVMPKTKKQVEDLAKDVHYNIFMVGLQRFRCFWSGLGDVFRNNTRFWTDGTPFVNSSIEFYGRIGGKCGRFCEDVDMGLGWRSSRCGNKLMFFCQK